jgi:acetoin utilization protein AcuB
MIQQNAVLIGSLSKERSMFVGDRMSHPVITVHPNMPMVDALALMRKEHIRRLPVVNKRGKLVGIITELDLVHASPSDATSLSIYEVNYLITKILVREVMTEKVITVTEDTPLEEAALIMADNKIGAMPVVRDEHLVGIITETDLFKVFLELLGAREEGVRLAALVADVPGKLATLTQSIFDIGGNILALGTFLGESTENREVTIKVAGVSSQALREAVDPIAARVIDIREPKPI